MKMCHFLLLISTLFVCQLARTATVTGHAILDGQTNHSGIAMSLGGSLTMPVFSLGGALILLTLTSYLLIHRRLKSGFTALLISLVLIGTNHLTAAQFDTVLTDSTGYFAFTNIATGHYRLTASKDCFVTEVIDPVSIGSTDLDLGTLNIGTLSSHNESLTAQNAKQLYVAQINYNHHSSPHTFTGNLACLVSGHGAGDVSLLPSDFADGIIDGYQYSLAVGDDCYFEGSYWCWTASAVPIVYACTGRKSFYIDDNNLCPGCMVQSGDLGGLPGHSGLPYVALDDESPSRLIHIAMQDIAEAQTDYINNTSPHTYAENLSVLGNGIYGIDLMCNEYDDGVLFNYNLNLEASEVNPDGVRTSWSCTAWPIVYGSDSVLSFYIDETQVVRASDIGGVQGTVSLPSTDVIVDSCP